MPRRSPRAALIDICTALPRRRLVGRYDRLVQGVHDEDEDALDCTLLDRLQPVLSLRYVCPRIQRPQATRFEWFLCERSDREFLRSFRMERGSFTRLAELTGRNKVFVCMPGKKKMASPQEQLLVFLKYIGTHSSDACIDNLGTIFSVATGSCADYIRRVTWSLMVLYKDVVTWPTAEERQDLSERIRPGYGFLTASG